jgi:hypothetical protein
MQHLAVQEYWLPVPKWPYDVSAYGHIRRSRGKRPVEVKIDTDGYSLVMLARGKKQQLYYLDTLIHAVHAGYPLNDERPVHLDGSPWNNWSNNLAWGIIPLHHNKENLVTHWSVIRGGHHLHGPFTDHNAAVAAASQLGDQIVWRNDTRTIIAYEVVHIHDHAKSPRNPFELVKQFRALATMHEDQFWNHDLHEAATMIEALAMENLALIAHGDKIDFSQEAKMDGVNGEQAPKPKRRSLDVADSEEWPIVAKRPSTRRVLADVPAKTTRRSLD